MPATRDKSDDDAAVEQDHGGHVTIDQANLPSDLLGIAASV